MTRPFSALWNRISLTRSVPSRPHSGKRPQSNKRLRRVFFEPLEERSLLATFAESSSTLAIQLGNSEGLGAVSNGTSYTLTLSGGNWTGVDSANVVGNGTATLTVTAAGLGAFNSVTIDDDVGAANTSVAFNDSGANFYSDDFVVTLDHASSGSISFSGATRFSDSSLLSVVASRNIVANSGSVVSTLNGDLSLSANQQAIPTIGSFSGIDLNGATISSTGGAVTLQGRGGNSGSGQYGVQLRNGGRAGVGTSGVVTVIGEGGASSGNDNHGVFVNSGSSLITSGGGNVVVTGRGGGSGASSGNHGVSLLLFGDIYATGTGNVTIDARGGVGGASHGLALPTRATGVFSDSGSIEITAVGGGAISHGVYLGGLNASNPAQIAAFLAGQVSVSGTGGPDPDSRGISMSFGEIRSAGADVQLTALASGTGGALQVAGSKILTSGNGNVTLISDSLEIDSASTISAQTRTVSLRPHTTNTPINLGGSDTSGTLGLTDAELDRVTAGTLTIGSSSASAITVSASISPALATGLSLITGANIIDANTTGNDLAASVLKLESVSGIGAIGDELEIAVSQLDVQNSTSGAVWLKEADSVTVNRLLMGGGSGWLSLAANTLIVPAGTDGNETVRNLGTGRTDLSATGAGGGLTLGEHSVRSNNLLILTTITNPIIISSPAGAREIIAGDTVYADAGIVGNATNPLEVEGARTLEINDPGAGDIYISEVGTSTITTTYVTVRGPNLGTIDVDYVGTNVVDINDNADVNNVVLDHNFTFVNNGVDASIRNIDVTGGTVSINGLLSDVNLYDDAITVTGSGDVSVAARFGANILDADGGTALSITTSGRVYLDGTLDIGTAASPIRFSATRLRSNTTDANQFLAPVGAMQVDGTLDAGTGTIRLDSGTVSLAASNQISDSTTIDVNGGTLAIGAFSDTIAGLVLTSGSVTGTTGVLTSTATAQLKSGSVSAILGGLAGVDKSTTGTVTLAGSNTYTGATTVTGGVLDLQNVSALGGVGSGTSVSTGATLQLALPSSANFNEPLTLSGTGYNSLGALRSTKFATLNGNITLAADATIIQANEGLSIGGNINNAGFLLTYNQNAVSSHAGDITGVISGAGGFRKEGQWQLNLYGNNTYAGATTVTAGILGVIQDGRLGNLTSGTVVQSGGSLFVGSTTYSFTEPLSITGTGATNYSSPGALLTNDGAVVAGPITLAGDSKLAHYGDTTAATISGAIGDGGNAFGFTLNTFGLANRTVILSGTNTYSGTTNVSSGRLRLSGGSAIADGAVSVASGATLELTASETIGSLAGAGNVELGANLLTTGANGATTSFSGVISGTGGVYKIGGGTLTLSGASTYSGGTVLIGGILEATKLADDGLPSSIGVGHILYLIGGTLRYVGAGDSTNRALGLSTEGGTIENASPTNGALNFTNTGSPSFNGSGSRQLSLIANPGSISLAASIGDFGGPTSLVATGLGDVTLSGNNTFTGPVTVGTGRLFVGDGGTTGSLGTGLVVNTGTIVLNRSNDFTVPNQIIGAGGLTKRGAGVATLSATNNSFAGPTIIEAGVLNATSLQNGGMNSSIGASTSDAANLVLDGGTLRFTGNAANTNRLFTLGPNGGTLESSGTGMLFLSNTSSVAYSGAGPRSLTLTGSSPGAFYGVLTDNVGPSSLTISGAGEWSIGNSNTYSGTTMVTGATVNVGDDMQTGTFGTLGTGDIVNNGALVYYKSDGYTLSNNISGTGSFTKNLDAYFYLTGDSTYSGPTVVNDGVLFVLGSIVSPVTMNPNTILGGNGSVGDVDLHTAGLLPGPGGGVFNTGSLSLDSTSAVEFEINGPDPGQYSQVISSGPISLGNAGLSLVFAPGYVPSAGKTFILVQNDGNLPASNPFKDAPEGSIVFHSGYALQISYVGGDGNDITATVVASTVVSGTVWVDVNGNGARDAGENGHAGQTVYADLNNNSQLDPGEPATTTSADDTNTPEDDGGQYELNLAAGNYVIRRVAAPGFGPSYPSPLVGVIPDSFAVSSHELTLTDEPVSNVDFGNFVSRQVNFTNLSLNVPESAGLVTITAELDAPLGLDLAVPVTIPPGSATSDVDFELLSGALFFPAGSTQGTFSLLVNQDDRFETDELVVVALTSRDGTTQGASFQQVIAIENDDPIPTIAFKDSNLTVNEGGTARVGVALSGETDLPVTVTISATLKPQYVNQAPTLGDVGSFTSTMLIQPGVKNVWFEIPIFDDNLAEGAELVDVKFVSVSSTAAVSTAGSSGGYLQNVITIPANDQPQVKFSRASDTATENGPNYTITVQLTNPSATPLSVPFKIAGSAGSGDRVISVNGTNLATNATAGTLTVPANATSATIIVNPTDDTTVELDQTVEIILQPSSSYYLQSTQKFTLTIDDNDTTKVGFATSTSTINVPSIFEDQNSPGQAARTVAITVTATNPSENGILVPISLSNTKNSGTRAYSGYALIGANNDFNFSAGNILIPAGATSATKLFTLNNDSIVEPTEQVTFTLGQPKNNVTGTPNLGTLGTKDYTLKILDDDRNVTFTTNKTEAGEGSSVVYTISIGTATSHPVVVDLTSTGTATYAADWTFSLPNSNLSVNAPRAVLKGATATIPTGFSSMSFTVNFANDSIDDNSQTVGFKITSKTSGAVVTDSTASATIIDNDSAPTLKFVTGNFTMLEDGSSYGVTVRRTGGTESTVYVRPQFVEDGVPAVPGRDFTFSGLNSNGYLEFAPSQSEKTFYLRPINRPGENGDRSFGIKLVSPQNATVVNGTYVYVYIWDDERDGVCRSTIPPATAGTIPAFGDFGDVPAGCLGLDGSANGPPLALESSGFIRSGAGYVAIQSSQGFLDGTSVFFDGNFNGIADFLDLNGDGVQDPGEPSEPVKRTKLDGSFSILIPPEFDQDASGQFEPHEGRWALFGGVDTSTDLPWNTRMYAPMGEYVITPHTTLVAELVRLFGLSLEDAEARVISAFSLPEVPLATFSPLKGLAVGDLAAGDYFASHASVYSTVVQIAELFAGASGTLTVDYFADLVYEDIATKIVDEGSLIDLKSVSTIADLINGVTSVTGIAFLEEQITQVSSIIAAGNQALADIPKTGDVAYATAVSKVKKVSQGAAAAALREVGAGTLSAETAASTYTQPNLQTLIDATVVGTIIPPALLIGDAVVREGNDGTRTLEFFVAISGDHSETVSVDYTTAGGSAQAGSDFVATSGTLTWAPHDVNPQSVLVTVNGDTEFEQDELVVLKLSNGQNVVLKKTSGTGYILNDDSVTYDTPLNPAGGENHLVLRHSVHRVGVDLNGVEISDGTWFDPLTIGVGGQNNVSDKLTLDFNAGTFRSDVIHFQGGGGSGIDSAEILGGSFQSITMQLTTATDGTTVLVPTDSDKTLTFQWFGLEPFLINSGSTTDLIFELPAGVTDAVLEDADPLDENPNLAGKLQLRSPSGHFETTIFNSPTSSLRIRGGLGVDSLTIGDLDVSFLGTIFVDGAALGDDGITVIHSGWTQAAGETIEGRHYQVLTKEDVSLKINDETAPTVIITPNGGSTTAASVTFTFQFSEAVTNFSAANLSVTNGSAAPVTMVDADTYTVVVTHAGPGTLGVSIGAGPVDLAGNALVGDRSASITIQALTDFGDAPDSYGTLLASGGPEHRAIGAQLGATRDTEPDGQPGAAANGDGSDEDGVIVPATLISRLGAKFTVTASAMGRLDAWIDFNRNGRFDDNEQIANGLVMLTGSNTFSIAVPGNMVAGPSYARFRLSSMAGLSPTGFAQDGEVEDYALNLAIPALGSAAVFSDPENPGQGVLVVRGTNNFYETIMVQPTAGQPGKVTASISPGPTVAGIDQATFGRIVIFGEAGIDSITIGGAITKPSVIYGDAGFDTINGGGGNDTIYGGADYDTLNGNGGDDTFVNEGGGDGVNGGAGFDTIVKQGSGTFSLSSYAVSASGDYISISGIEKARLIGGPGADVFNFTGWNGAAEVDGGGGANTIVDSADGNFVLQTGQLSRTVGDNTVTIQFTNVENAQLTGGFGNNAFDLSNWPNTAVIDGGYFGADSVTVAGDVNYTLSTALIMRPSLGLIRVAGLEQATLIGGPSDNTFNVVNWSGAATLNGLDGIDKVIAGGNVNFTLTDTALTRSAGGATTLSSIEQADLTGGAANNTISAAGYSGEVKIDGGAGNDTITSGSGIAILLGGAGNDVLNAGSGRAVMIGGAGLDRLTGGSNDDLLISGQTAHDANAIALAAILAEWASSSSYADRVAHLTGTPGGLNNGKYLSGGNVTHDADIDNLFGGLGADLFFAKLSNPAKDVIDQESGESAF